VYRLRYSNRDATIIEHRMPAMVASSNDSQTLLRLRVSNALLTDPRRKGTKYIYRQETVRTEAPCDVYAWRVTSEVCVMYALLSQRSEGTVTTPRPRRVHAR
jgi:hypothetical protein